MFLLMILQEECLKRHVFEALQENKRIMKYKKQLSALAHGYRSLTVFRRIFPVWFEKVMEFIELLPGLHPSPLPFCMVCSDGLCVTSCDFFPPSV